MNPKSNVVKGICRMCLRRCGIDIRLEGGRVAKVTGMPEHHRNRLCLKAQAIPDFLYSPERITHPLRKIDGKWQEISSGEAFDIVAEKLTGIKERYGAKSLVVHLGEPMIGSEAARVAAGFCSLYGTPNYTSAGSLCFAARGIGHGLTMNRIMMPLFPSYENTKCVVVWGHNPLHSNFGEETDILEARKSGAKLVVIDPRVTSLAREADLFLQIRPGTDGALALAVLNVIISEGLYNKGFVENFTVGFDKLVEHVNKYTPEGVADITGIPSEKIRQFAKTYATSKPATISQGVSLDHCPNGVQNSRAVAILIAVTGNLDIDGGNIYNFPLEQRSLRVKGRVSVGDAIGAQYPIYGKFTRETTAMPLADIVLSEKPYPVKALILQGSNPLLTWPDSNRLKSAFEKLDLLVVCDLFLTETAEYADIFLPMAAFAERRTVTDYFFEGLPLVTLSNKAVEPPPGCLEDWQVWAELGKRMGYGEYFPWQNADELFNYLLEPSGVTLKQLEQSAGGVIYRAGDVRRKYEKEGLPTPSGKVEIFSQTLADYGYDPLPTFTEPVIDAKVANDYPFTLISGTRINAFNSGRYHNIARLRKLVPEPLVEINSATAAESGINDGDRVAVESPAGRIELKAEVTADILPGVLSIQHGWDGANVNILTGSGPVDPISGYPGFKTTPCRVRKISK